MAVFGFNNIYTYLRKYKCTIICYRLQNIEKILKQNASLFLTSIRADFQRAMVQSFSLPKLKNTQWMSNVWTQMDRGQDVNEEKLLR